MVCYAGDGNSTGDRGPRACDEADSIRLVSVFAIGGWIRGCGTECAEVASPHHGGGESCSTCLGHCVVSLQRIQGLGRKASVVFELDSGELEKGNSACARRGLKFGAGPRSAEAKPVTIIRL